MFRHFKIRSCGLHLHAVAQLLYNLLEVVVAFQLFRFSIKNFRLASVWGEWRRGFLGSKLQVVATDRDGRGHMSFYDRDRDRDP